MRSRQQRVKALEETSSPREPSALEITVSRPILDVGRDGESRATGRTLRRRVRIVGESRAEDTGEVETHV